MTFAPIERPESAVDACEASLRRAILSGELAAGSRLPAERSLAERFGVNRVTVRTALDRLAAARLLSVRQGSGYVVQDFARRGGPDLLPGIVGLARGRGDLREVAADLLLVRRQLARAVLERALAGWTPSAREAMTAAVDRLDEAASSGASTAQLARADLEVTGALVEATSSAVLRLCLNPVAEVLAGLPELRDAMYAEPAANVIAWRALIAALDAPPADLVGVIMGAIEERDARTIERLAREERST